MDKRTSEVVTALVNWFADNKQHDDMGTERLDNLTLLCVRFGLTIEQTLEAISAFAEQHPFAANRKPNADYILESVAYWDHCGERNKWREIRNYGLQTLTTPKGEKEVPFALPLSEIISEIHDATEGAIRRIDNVLFIDDAEHGVCYFGRGPAAFIGWLRNQFRVHWKSGGSFTTESELVAELERTAPKCSTVELLPHHPPVDGVYYAASEIAGGSGQALTALINRFRPETTIDRQLILAAMLTAFWGGPAGTRPAFVITSDHGRGSGKTKLAEAIAYLCGGMLDISANEDIGTIKQRMLSPAGQSKRVAMLDNVKSLRFSWAELEALITAPMISGKRLYVGEGQRPNLITWLITLNGVNLSEDMAQRSVIIKLAKGENEGSWWEETIQYIDANRAAIIGDILTILKSEATPLANYSRWATWEQHVMSRLPEPNEVQRLILERQGECSSDREEAEIIESYFAEQLAELGHDPSTAQMRLPTSLCSKWLSHVMDARISLRASTAKLKQMANEGQLKRLAPDPSRTHGRNFIWTGEDADNHCDLISNELTNRIKQEINNYE